MRETHELRRSLRLSLQEIIDYAGLFPPAALAPGPAIAEFLVQSKDPALNWMFRRFVLPFVPAPRCQEIIAGFAQVAKQAVAQDGLTGLPSSWHGCIPISALLPALEAAAVTDFAVLSDALAHARSSFENGWHLLDIPAVAEQSLFRLETVEWALPLDHGSWDDRRQAAVRTAFRAMRDLEPELKIYIEVNWQGWSPAVVDLLKDLARDRSDIFCKIRTGGLTAATVPPPAVLARILCDLVAAGIGFKCTAGLHAALYETSPRFGFEMHGFVNLLCATAAVAARTNLKEQDILPLLTMRQADHVFGLLEEKLGQDACAAIARSRHYMHSFGSCSVTEPCDSLNSLLKGMGL